MDGNQRCGCGGGWARLSKKAERDQIRSKDSGDASSNTLSLSKRLSLECEGMGHAFSALSILVVPFIFVAKSDCLSQPKSP